MFLSILRATIRLVYAYRLVPNHFHLLIDTKQFPLVETMQRFLTRYVKGFNFRHRHFFSLVTVVYF